MAMATRNRLLAGLLAGLLLLAACGPKPETETVQPAADAAAEAEADAALAESQRLEAARTEFQAAVAAGDDDRIFALADEGNPFALFYRGEARLKSDLQYEQQEGFKDMEAAADAGSPDAQLWVGLRMAKGMDGYSYKPNSGLMMVEKAAKAGHGEAMYALGELYESGLMHDIDKAKDWYGKAAVAGVEKAKEALAGLEAPAGEQ
jgi:localization factor PodJL